MSCCPSVKCRNTGSGYVKSGTGSSTECSKKLDELLAARTAQDNTYFPPIGGLPVSPPQKPAQTNVCSSGICLAPPLNKHGSNGPNTYSDSKTRK